ncbi:MAG: VWA domain-containing protein, partial [Sciscionella sp.]
MEASIHRFVRLLRIRGVRVSVSEAIDAMRCAGEPDVLADRETLRAGLRVALVKDVRDEHAFDEVFDAFFALVRVGNTERGHGHGHGHDDLTDTGELDSFTLSDEPGEIPEQGHEHGSPADIRDYFDPADLAQQYNLHQEANKIDMASMTDEIVFSQDGDEATAQGYRVQLETDRLHGAAQPQGLSTASGTKIDTDLTLSQQEALLTWLEDVQEQFGDETDAAALLEGLRGVLANLPAALKKHIESLLTLEQRVVESRERAKATVPSASERERLELEESLRRLANTLHGALTHSHRVAARGRIDANRTMRRNMRYDGIPFQPVTVRRTEDKPRLVVLADVSLSVRATARFTLQLVHGLQHLFAQVRSFAFVAELVEITELFD